MNPVPLHCGLLRAGVSLALPSVGPSYAHSRGSIKAGTGWGVKGVVRSLAKVLTSVELLGQAGLLLLGARGAWQNAGALAGG